MLSKIKQRLDDLTNTIHVDGDGVYPIAAMVATNTKLTCRVRDLMEGEPMLEDTLYDFYCGDRGAANTHTYAMLYSDTIEELYYTSPSTFDSSLQFCHIFWAYKYSNGIWSSFDFAVPVSRFTTIASGRPLNYPNGYTKPMADIIKDYNRAMGVI